MSGAGSLLAFVTLFWAFDVRNESNADAIIGYSTRVIACGYEYEQPQGESIYTTYHTLAARTSSYDAAEWNLDLEDYIRSWDFDSNCHDDETGNPNVGVYVEIRPIERLDSEQRNVYATADPIATFYVNAWGADLDRNGMVGVPDYLIFSLCYNKPIAPECESSDFDRDGRVGGFDYLLFGRQYNGIPIQNVWTAE